MSKKRRITIDNVTVVTIDRGLQCLDFARVAARHGRKVRDLSSHNAVPMILPG